MKKIRQTLNKTINICGVYELPVLTVVICLAFFILAVIAKPDNDNWFQIAHARVIFEKGFVREEPLTMHRGLNFMIPQWLTAVIISVLYERFGAVLMNVFFLSFVAGTWLILVKTGILISGKKEISYFISSLLMTVYVVVFYAPRPHMISMFLIAFELYALEKYKHGERKWIWALPLVSVAMINLHNSLWFYTIVCALPYVAEFIILKKGPEKISKEAVIAPALMILCGLINPYGVDAITYLFTSLKSTSVMSNYIIEMMPTGKRTSSMMMLLLPIATIGAFCFNKRKETIPIRYYLLWCGTFVLAIKNIRSWIQFLICGYPLMLSAFSEVRITVKDGVKWSMSGVLPVVICASASIFGWVNPMQDETISKNESFMQYMSEHVPKDAVIFNTLNLGSYLEYSGYKPYIDTRNEVFGIENNKVFDYAKEYEDVAFRGIDPKSFLEKYHFDTLVAESGECGALIKYVDDSAGWEKTYNDDVFIIYQTTANGQ